MNSLKPISKVNELVHGQSFDITALGNLLNQFSLPCSIIDIRHNSIVQVNSELISLTTFTSDELIGSRFSDLFVAERESLNLENGFGNLKRRNKPVLRVAIKFVELNESNQWGLVTFSPTGALDADMLSNKSLLNTLIDLCIFPDEFSVSQYCILAIKEMSEQFSSDFVCFYHQDHDSEEVIRLNETDKSSIFPEILKVNDFLQMDDVDVWKSGKRVLNEIQRIARKNNMDCVIQIKIHQNNNKNDLLVIAFEELSSLNLDFEEITLLAQVIKNSLNKINDHEKLINQIQRQGLIVSLQKLHFETDNLPLILTDPDLRIIEINSEAERNFGYSIWEVKSSSIETLLSSKEQIIYSDQISLDLLPKLIELVHLQRRDGSVFPAQIQIVPIPLNEESNKLGSVLFSIFDKTENETYKNQVSQLERQAVIGGLMANFAHDVRNPINSIVIATDTLNNKLKADSTSLSLLNSIQDDCNRIDQLMESVLSFSRPIEEQLKPMIITDFLQRLLERWRLKIQRIKAVPVFQKDGEIPQIMGDIRSLEQVFNNLIGNAIDAMSSTGGTLGIYIDREQINKNNVNVRIRVSDSGPGIPEELLGKVFEPYVSIREKGTGLGLAISKKIIAAHHGLISVDSFPGGTTFVITFPALKDGENR